MACLVIFLTRNILQSTAQNVNVRGFVRIVNKKTKVMNLHLKCNIQCQLKCMLCECIFLHIHFVLVQLTIFNSIEMIKYDNDRWRWYDYCVSGFGIAGREKKKVISFVSKYILF